MIVCHTCWAVIEGGWRESHDHAADEHRSAYLATPGLLVFTRLDGVREATS